MKSIAFTLLALSIGAHAAPIPTSKPWSQQERVTYVTGVSKPLTKHEIKDLIDSLKKAQIEKVPATFEVVLKKQALNVAYDGQSKTSAQDIVTELSLVQGSEASARIATQTWYLEDGKARPVEDYEAFIVKSVTPLAAVMDPRPETQYCFELRYGSQYVSSYSVLAMGEKKPILDTEEWTDMICLKRGEERVFSKNFRQNPVQWSFKLNLLP